MHLEGRYDKSFERFSQIKSLFKQILKRLTVHGIKKEEANLFIAGDFNCNYKSGLYKLLREGSIPAGYVDPLTSHPYSTTEYKHPFSLESAYGTYKDGYDFTYAEKNKRMDPIDFIW